MDKATELFCLVDDFCQQFEPLLDKCMLEHSSAEDDSGKRRRNRPCLMSLSEMFHRMRARQFKAFYLGIVCRFMKAKFPRRLSYSRFVQLMPRCAAVLAALFQTLKGACTGISIADSTPLAVCENLALSKRHRVFQGIAQRGKSSTGWFYGFKLHAVINHQGELLAIKVTPGNVDDRKGLLPIVLNLFGKMYADKGYLGKEFVQQMKDKGIDIVTRVHKNMKEVVHSEFDQALLRKRALVETVFDELKNLCQIEHTRHRSLMNFAVNLMAGIVAYCLQPVKPRIQLRDCRDALAVS